MGKLMALPSRLAASGDLATVEMANPIPTNTSVPRTISAPRVSRLPAILA